ncbi:MAG: response regulator transcription factor [Synechococcaceae cyanobacterium RL_1_2]|nr:response regulator transcription factor [Synechococcaceae cyanobacterium RL_1_2]
MAFPISPALPLILFIRIDNSFFDRATYDLQSLGYTTFNSQNLTESLRLIQEYQPVLIVIDGTITKNLGDEFCRNLRVQGHRESLIMVLDEDNLSQRIRLMEAGVDDYLLYPYQSERFIHMVSWHLKPSEEEAFILSYGDVTLDLQEHKVLRGNETIELTMKEFKLLKYLMEHPEQILTREQILENVWGYHFQGASNVIEVYIRYLRLKLEDRSQKRIIQTVRGTGYMLKMD